MFDTVCSLPISVHRKRAAKRLKPDHPPASDKSSDGSDTSSSSNASDKADVGAALADGEPKVEALAEPTSGDEVEPMVADPPVDGYAAADPAAVAVVAPFPLPAEALDDMKPAFDLGVQRADICRTTASKCSFCGDPLVKGNVRFGYHKFKSAMRYMHPECMARAPAEHLAHSVACLRYQRHFGGGPDVLPINDAIDASLLLIGRIQELRVCQKFSFIISVKFQPNAT